MGVIEPYYPKGKRGHSPMGIEKMLRMYLHRSGSTYLTRQQRVQSMTATLCGNSRGSTLWPKRSRMKRRCANSAIFWRKTNWTSCFSMLSIAAQQPSAGQWQRNRLETVHRKQQISVCCKVEHAFRIIKCQLGYKKVVYRGLKKNENRLIYIS